MGEDLGYHRVDADAPPPLRKPLAQVRREEIEEQLRAGISVEALMNSGGATFGELDAYFSNADAFFPGDPLEHGGGDAA